MALQEDREERTGQRRQGGEGRKRAGLLSQIIVGAWGRTG